MLTNDSQVPRKFVPCYRTVQEDLFALGARGCEFESRQLSVLEIPLDKELTANWFVKTRTKLEELIPAAMVTYELNRVQVPLWFQQSLINGFSWFGFSWATLISEHM